MTDTSQTAATQKQPISGSTLVRSGSIAGLFAGGPQVLVPLVHQWDVTHYAAAQMPDANFEWSVATCILAAGAFLVSLLVRGQAIVAADLKGKIQ